MELVKNPKLFWAFIGSSAAFWQYRSLKTHNGGTGSETTRAVWRTHTKTGRIAFLTAYFVGNAVFSAWFPRHIIDPVKNAVLQISGTEEEKTNGN